MTVGNDSTERTLPRRPRSMDKVCHVLRWIVRRAVVAFVLSALLVFPATAQSCPGDCNGNRSVGVDELLTCLGIGLQTAGRERCFACDADLDGTVGIDEVVRAVAAALRRLVVEASGTCVLPGAAGLVPCAEGTMVQVGRCDDRSACLRNSAAVVSVAAEPVGAEGRFSLVMDRCQITGEALVFEAQVRQDTGTKYRTMDFGSLAGGSALGVPPPSPSPVDEILIGPASEAAVRVLQENGLENFDDQGAGEILATAEASNDETDFAGLDPDSAADLAEQTAAEDPAVQAVVNRSRTLCIEPEFTLRLDNGVALQGIGVNNVASGGNEGSPFIWLNRHIVNSADLPITIAALSNVWPARTSELVGGESVQMLVYVDADADGDPSNAELIGSQSLAVPTPDDSERQVHPFQKPVVIDRPGDLYVGFADLQSGIDRAIRYMALQDDSGSGARSFIIFNNDPAAPIDFAILANDDVIQPASVVVPGAWLVRAHGMCGN